MPEGLDAEDAASPRAWQAVGVGVLLLARDGQGRRAPARRPEALLDALLGLVARRPAGAPPARRRVPAPAARP